MDNANSSSLSYLIPTLINITLGRSQEIATACTLLRRPEVRLLTLTGPGGVGKTRLATEIAHELVPAFTDGIFFVSLAPLRSPALVLPAIAQALSLSDTGQQPLTELLYAYLHDRHILLVLDNFEHLLTAGPQVAMLLTVAPHLKLLVTSREALHLYGEHEFEVFPLALPNLDDITSTRSVLSSHPAIALFVERAQAVKPIFTLTSENMHAIADICTQLDGLPLAIELAAARSKLLSPQELLARLQPRLRLLTGGARDLPTRQQTLRNTLDWSYQLLTEEEQRFFCRLGIFVGSWSLEATSTLASMDSETAFELLSSLVDKSLVRSLSDSSGTTRFQLLETIREYALEWLEKRGELQETQKRYIQFYIQLAEEAEPHLIGRAQYHWLQRLDQDAANLHQTMQWVILHHRVHDALRLASALISYLQLRSTLGEIRSWLEQVLQQDSPPSSTLLRARVTYGAVMMAFKQNNLVQACAYAEESEQIALQVGSIRVIGLSRALRASILQEQGNTEHTYALALDALHVLDQSNEGWTRGIVHSLCGIIASRQHNFAQAHVHYKLSLTLLRKAGDLHSEADVLVNVGRLTHLRGKLHTAQFLYQKALKLYQDTNDRWGQLVCLLSIGEALHLQGAFVEAHRILIEGLTLATTLGTRREYTLALYALGMVELAQGHLSQASQYQKEALHIARELDYLAGIALSLHGLGAIAFAHDHLDSAKSYYEQSQSVARTLGDKMLQVDNLCGLGRVAVAQKTYPQANHNIKQAIQIAWDIGDMVGLATALATFAYLCGQLTHLERATQFLSTADTLCQALHASRVALHQAPDHHYEAWLQEHIGETAFHENWMVGQTMTLKHTLGMIAQLHVTDTQQNEPMQPSTPYPAGLTAREVDVLRLVAQGLSDVRIAQQLVLSPRTVNTHLRSIYNKLGVSSRSVATRRAFEYKLVQS